MRLCRPNRIRRGFEATVPMEGIDHAAGLLLGFADDIEVLEPAALRTRLAEQARRVFRLYR
ncbi:MAG TPA: WYL domain-containing protein [Blastocatellia bacterium]